MENEKELLQFAAPYYAGKDIMHNLWHIELVKISIEKLLSRADYCVDRDCLTLAVYFHGFIYHAEQDIRAWLNAQHYDEDFIEKVITVSWESQRREIPETLEGKILHDAHVLEGGKTYLVVKTLITGSVRGQSLMQTLDYMKDNVLGKNHCCLPETIPLCEEMNQYADTFYQEIMEGIR